MQTYVTSSGFRRIVLDLLMEGVSRHVGCLSSEYQCDHCCMADNASNVGNIGTTGCDGDDGDDEGFDGDDGDNDDIPAA
jgi:hypothetical protein